MQFEWSDIEHFIYEYSKFRSYMLSQQKSDDSVGKKLSH